MALRAIGDRVIVGKRLTFDPLVYGRLVRPTTLTERQSDGEVLSAGERSGCVPGEKVVFSGMSGTVIECENGDDMIVLRKSEILGKMS